VSPSHCAGPSSSCVSNTLSCSAYNTYTAQASAFLVSLTPYHALPMTLTHTVQASLFLYLQHPIMLRLQHTHTAQASALLVSSTPCYALLWHALTLCRPQLFLRLQHPIMPCLWHTHTAQASALPVSSTPYHALPMAHTHTHAHTRTHTLCRPQLVLRLHLIKLCLRRPFCCVAPCGGALSCSSGVPDCHAPAGKNMMCQC